MATPGNFIKTGILLENSWNLNFKVGWPPCEIMRQNISKIKHHNHKNIKPASILNSFGVSL